MVLNSAIATLQARRLAKQTGIAPSIRYIDASAEPEWEKARPKPRKLLRWAKNRWRTWLRRSISSVAR